MSPEVSTRATRIVTETVYPWAGAVTSTIGHSLYAGDRSRTETLDPPAIAFVVERRDLRQRLRVFVSKKKYQIIPLFDLATAQEKADFQYSGRHWSKRVNCQTARATRELKINVTYERTGEERLMFGCAASRWRASS